MKVTLSLESHILVQGVFNYLSVSVSILWQLPFTPLTACHSTFCLFSIINCIVSLSLALQLCLVLLQDIKLTCIARWQSISKYTQKTYITLLLLIVRSVSTCTYVCIHAYHDIQFPHYQCVRLYLPPQLQSSLHEPKGPVDFQYSETLLKLWHSNFRCQRRQFLCNNLSLVELLVLGQDSLSPYPCLTSNLQNSRTLTHS